MKQGIWITANTGHCLTSRSIRIPSKQRVHITVNVRPYMGDQYGD